MAELYERFDTGTNHLGRLKKLKPLGTVEEFIVAFECLDFRTEGMSDAFFQDCFISGLKNEIWAHVLMAQPQSWLEATKRERRTQNYIFSKPKTLLYPSP